MKSYGKTGEPSKERGKVSFCSVCDDRPTELHPKSIKSCNNGHQELWPSQDIKLHYQVVINMHVCFSLRPESCSFLHRLPS